MLALADQLEERLAKAPGQVDALTPSLPPSLGYGGTGFARAWTHSLPARSGCAFRSARFFSHVPNAFKSPANSSSKTPPTNLPQF